MQIVMEDTNKMVVRTKLPSIPGFYAGKNIFITGSSGFIGKVLIEKLLRSCPDVNNVYLLFRAKRGVDGQDRLKKILEMPLFEKLKAERPDAFKKLKIINGDLTKLKLGLSEEDIHFLKENINIVFHVAANVKFDDSFREAVFTNLRSTRELAELAKGMKNLKVFVHVSTTYCNTDKREVEEIVYPPKFDWKKAIEIAESIDEMLLNSLSLKIFDVLPNSYVFTKSLTENLIDDYRNELPVLVFRPSIVVSTNEDPIPGWCDNFHNIVGFLIGAFKGVLHVNYQKSGITMDFMPVDIIVKALLAATVERGIEKNKLDVTPVYNGSSNLTNTLELKEVLQMGKVINEMFPVSDTLWHPSGSIVSYKWLAYVLKVITQFLPGLIIDTMLNISGKKPMLLNIYSKVERGYVATVFYANNMWYFRNQKLLSLLDGINEEDIANFNFKFTDIDKFEFMKAGALGGRRYLLKEKDETLPKARERGKRMYYLHTTLKCLLYAVLFWYVIQYTKHYSIETYYALKEI